VDKDKTMADPQSPQGFPSQYDNQGISSFDKEEEKLRGAALTLEVQCSTGEKIDIKVFMGQDVALAKGKLAEKLQVPYGKIKIFKDEKLMFDPLSFNDFPDIVNATGPISVTAQIDS